MVLFQSYPNLFSTPPPLFNPSNLNDFKLYKINRTCYVNLFNHVQTKYFLILKSRKYLKTNLDFICGEIFLFIEQRTKEKLEVAIFHNLNWLIKNVDATLSNETSL